MAERIAWTSENSDRSEFSSWAFVIALALAVLDDDARAMTWDIRVILIDRPEEKVDFLAMLFSEAPAIRFSEAHNGT